MELFMKMGELVCTRRNKGKRMDQAVFRKILLCAFEAGVVKREAPF
jgi:hypothetical protein